MSGTLYGGVWQGFSRLLKTCRPSELLYAHNGICCPWSLSITSLTACNIAVDPVLLFVETTRHTEVRFLFHLHTCISDLVCCATWYKLYLRFIIFVPLYALRMVS